MLKGLKYALKVFMAGSEIHVSYKHFPNSIHCNKTSNINIKCMHVCAYVHTHSYTHTVTHKRTQSISRSPRACIGA